MLVVVVVFIDRNVLSGQREQEKTLLSKCKNTANTYKSTISQDNNHQAKFKLTREKMKWQFQSYIDKIKWHTTNYINFSTIKNGNVRKRHSTKLRSNVITQWAVTNHMLVRLYYTTAGQSIFCGYTTLSTRLCGQLCDDSLNRVAYTRSRSGIHCNEILMSATCFMNSCECYVI